MWIRESLGDKNGLREMDRGWEEKRERESGRNPARLRDV